MVLVWVTGASGHVKLDNQPGPTVPTSPSLSSAPVKASAPLLPQTPLPPPFGNSGRRYTPFPTACGRAASLLLLEQRSAKRNPRATSIRQPVYVQPMN